MAGKNPKSTGNQITMIKRRNLDPNNYRVIKETWCNLYLLDVRYNKVKIIYKYT